MAIAWASERYALISQGNTGRMQPKSGYHYKAAMRPYFLADEVNYERLWLAHYIGESLR